MTLPLTICAICSTRFEAKTSYGLCSTCYSKDKLREWDRLQSAIKRAQHENLPTTLTLVQWLSTVSDHLGRCAFCQQAPHSTIETIFHSAGLTWQNVVPCCRSCAEIKRVGWEKICVRVMQYLMANEGRTETDVNLEYFAETPSD
jgi:hypothetical protein